MLCVVLSISLAAAADAAVASAMKKTHVPGVVVAVSSHGVVQFAKAYGVKDLGKQTPMTIDAQFEVGSITKQFTAAAVLTLVEAGKLSLDAPLSRYVPEYNVGATVTIRQLLWQTSGIPNYTATPEFVKEATTREPSLDAILHLIDGHPLHFGPGTQWEYSNTNYYLLAFVIAAVSGSSYEEYLRTHVFKPAAMTHSSFISSEKSLIGMPTGYLGSPLRPSQKAAGGWAAGCGDVVSTAGDLLAWDDALMHGRVLPLRDVVLMRSPGVLISGKHTTYGMGWYIDRLENGTLTVWHNGGTFGFSADNETFPTTDEAIVVLDNYIDADAEDIAKATWLAYTRL